MKERIAKECRSKEKIIRLILENEYLAASDIYKLTCDAHKGPSKLWADEISAYVRDHLRDPEMVEIYFPNLPPRPFSTVDLDTLIVINARKRQRKPDGRLKVCASKSLVNHLMNHESLICIVCIRYVQIKVVK